ncbi:MAG: nitrile hydratase accessory protein [Pseudomonadota bacterium]
MTPSLDALPGIALADGAPVFAEPWEAQAFAMAVHLHARGAFTWDEWAAALSTEIHSGAARSYYAHWLTALERIAAEKNLTSATELSERKDAWQAAAARTPHGDPITL